MSKWAVSDGTVHLKVKENKNSLFKVAIIFKFKFSDFSLTQYVPPPPRLQFVSTIAKTNNDNSYPLTKYITRNNIF